MKQGYEAWAATVSPTNSMFVDFVDSGDSLKRISELVIYDDIRREQIDAAIQDALDKIKQPSTTKLTTSTNPEDQEEFFQGNKTNLEVDSGASEDGSIVVGFGSKINGNGDFSRIAVCYLNMSTGKRIWKAFGNVDTFNWSDYDTIGVVPDGCVLTGIGFMEKAPSLISINMIKMVLNYQELTPASSTYNYLDNNLQQIAFIGEKETGVGGDDYQIEFNPSSNNDMVITGIGVNYSGNKNKVNRLKLYRNILVETEIELTDD